MKEEDFAERLKSVGRNDQCPCGSGKKYKKCHRQEDEALQLEAAQKEHKEGAADEAAVAALEKKDATANFSGGDHRQKLKQGKTVTRSNAMRRQAGK